MVDRLVEADPAQVGDLLRPQAMPTARAPKIFASCPTVAPTGPLAAATTTVSPAFGRPIWVRPAYAVKPGMPTTPSAVVTGALPGSSLRTVEPFCTPYFCHRVYGVQLWMPEAGGRVDYASEHDERAMTVLGLSSKREITRTSIRVRTAMAAQTRAATCSTLPAGPGSTRRCSPAGASGRRRGPVHRLRRPSDGQTDEQGPVPGLNGDANRDSWQQRPRSGLAGELNPRTWPSLIHASGEAQTAQQVHRLVDD